MTNTVKLNFKIIQFIEKHNHNMTPEEIAAYCYLDSSVIYGYLKTQGMKPYRAESYRTRLNTLDYAKSKGLVYDLKRLCFT